MRIGLKRGLIKLSLHEHRLVWFANQNTQKQIK